MEQKHEQGTVYVDSSNLDIVLSVKPLNMLQLFWKEIKHDILGFISLCLLIIIFLGIYIGAPIITSRMNVMKNNLLMANKSPDYYKDSSESKLKTFLGTEYTGKFMAPLLIVSARNSLNIALAVTTISFIIGLTIGIICGFYGGKVDWIVMRLVDTWTMLPSFMVTITLITIAPRKTPLLFITFLTMFSWMGRTRLVRAASLQNRNMDYISASKTMGTRNIVIIFREMFPNMVDVIVANFVLTLSASIGIETGLSMLGFGLGIEHPSLGTLSAYALETVNLEFRWWTWVPSIALVVTIMLCITFVGNVLQRVADPKQRLV